MRRLALTTLFCLAATLAQAQQQMRSVRLDGGPGRQGSLVFDNGYGQTVEFKQDINPELNIKSSTPGNNVLSIQNMLGISGMAFRDPAGIERGAIGYTDKTQGTDDSYPFWHTAYWEISTFCVQVVGECAAIGSASTRPPVKGRIVQTGYVALPNGTSAYGNYIKQEFTADGSTTRFWRLATNDRFPLAVNNYTGNVAINWPGSSSTQTYPNKQNNLDVLGTVTFGDIQDRAAATSTFNVIAQYGNLAKWSMPSMGQFEFQMATASAAQGGAKEFTFIDASNGKTGLSVLMNGTGDVRLGGNLRMTNKGTTAGIAPGAATGTIEFRCGTTAGTGKLVVYSGTSATAVTLADNIGTGVSGC